VYYLCDAGSRQEASRVIAGLPAKTTYRALVVLWPLLLGLVLLAGCELESYPEELTYPPRTDPLVIEHASRDAPDFDRPGEFPHVLFAGLTDEERDKLLKDPLTLNDDQRQQLQTTLTDLFGTPAHPTVKGSGDAAEAVAKLRNTLQLDETTLTRGSNLYRINCLHCHGLTGDGRGPTAPWVNPHPRDYRQGIFKFTSSSQQEGTRRPRKDDIVRTIHEGIEGSSMPSFRLLPDEDLDSIASYVIHLSIRGETEFGVMRTFLTGEPEGSVQENVEQYLAAVAGWWQTAQDSMIKPTGSEPKLNEASVQRGFNLFIQAKEGVGCIGCHTDYGRQAPHKYDYWGTIVRPANIVAGVYRGGRRPIDLYWRIYAGINGTGMTAFGNTEGITSEKLWDLVHFLQVVPYPAMREKYHIQLEAEGAAQALAARAQVP
jgi:mono/diheme cytochrome c family protein